MNNKITWFFIMNIAHSSMSWASTEIDWKQLSWEPRLETDGVLVQTANYPGSGYLAVNSSMVVNARLQDVVNLVLLNDGCHEGSTTCDFVKKIQILSPHSYLQYVISNFPWPLKQRDIVLHVNIHQDQLGIVRITGRSQPEKYQEQNNIVRIRTMNVLWQLTPLSSKDNNQILVEHYIHSKPEGFILPWVFNEAVDKVPLETFQNIRRLLKKAKYQNRQIEFIQETND